LVADITGQWRTDGLARESGQAVNFCMTRHRWAACSSPGQSYKVRVITVYAIR
jgi:hypothetical protein